MATGTRRTTLRSRAGKKLYAVRDASGKFKDIQTYERAHRADLKKKSAAEKATAARKVAKKATKKAAKKTVKKVAKKAVKKVTRKTAKKVAKKVTRKVTKKTTRPGAAGAVRAAATTARKAIRPKGHD